MSTGSSEMATGTFAVFVTLIPAGRVTLCPFSMNVSLTMTALTSPRAAASQNPIAAEAGFGAGRGPSPRANLPITIARATSRIGGRAMTSSFIKALLKLAGFPMGEIRLSVPPPFSEVLTVDFYP